MPERSGQWQLWISPAEEHATSTFVGYGVFPEWSPVDDRILFQRARQRGSRWYSIWTIEMVDGEPRYPTEIAASADHAMILPAWSRDARRVAFTTASSLPDIDPEFGSVYERSDIWVMDADGGSRIRLTDGHSVNFGPTWGPNDRVYFTSSRNGHETIWSVLPTRGMTPTPDTGMVSGADEPASNVRPVSASGQREFGNSPDGS
jgi:Tol biopolymer transport system component